MEKFDTEMFIIEIEAHPAIWDSRSLEYSNKIEKSKAWEEMCLKFIPDFKIKSISEKNIAATQLQRRWKNIRDCFNRELAKIKNTKSGSAASFRKQYVYYNQLTFLLPVCESKVSVSSLTQRIDEHDEKKYDEDNFIKSDDTEPQVTKRKRIPSAEQKLLEKLSDSIDYKLKTGNENDPDKHFLLSLLPELKQIPEELKLEAKFDIMNVIKKYKLQHNVQYQNFSTSPHIRNYDYVAESHSINQFSSQSNFPSSSKMYSSKKLLHNNDNLISVSNVPSACSNISIDSDISDDNSIITNII